MSNRLLGITFLVATIITLVSAYFFNNGISKNSTDSIVWILPMGIGLSFDMICGVIGIKKFFRALSE